MGLCKDKSTTYLAGLGYNVVRHPSAGFRPLGLLGRQNKATLQLGPLNLLITNPPGPLPAITSDVPAADINGQTSSKLSIGIGINILGTLIGAMGGGNLGANLNFTNAQQVEFSYTDVTNDSAVPLEVGNYLRSAAVDAGNLILEQYVLGNGELFLITKIAKSKKFSIKFEKSNGVDAKVDVPAIQQIAGGKITVGASGDSKSTLSFEGATPLRFAFQCFQVGVVDGVLSLTSVQAGAVPAAFAGGEKAFALVTNGLLDLEKGPVVT
jgi:hypothetical protein